MEPSDWIAIAALAASVIISIAGFWFNYKTNQENIKAKRAELVAEKSVEVYREMIGKLNVLVYEQVDSPSEISKSVTDCLQYLIKNRLFFPRHIANDLVFTLKNLQEQLTKAKKGDLKVSSDEMKAAFMKALKFIDRLQRYIGVAPEEISKR